MVKKPTSLNPFNYRAGTEPNAEESAKWTTSLNPFNYRAGTERTSTNGAPGSWPSQSLQLQGWY